MLQILLSTFITIVLSGVGVLLGLHIGRRWYGMTNRWEGWDAEIDFLLWAIRQGRDKDR